MAEKLWDATDITNADSIVPSEWMDMTLNNIVPNTAARHDAVTVSDSSEIDFSLTGQDLTASLKTGSIDVLKLDSGVQSSLGLADSAIQSGDSPSFAGLTVDTDTLYVDSTNHRVGIDTTSPSAKLDIVTSGTNKGIELNNGGTLHGLEYIQTGDLNQYQRGFNLYTNVDRSNPDTELLYIHSDNPSETQTLVNFRNDGSGR